ncbi:MAG: hypothetical protein U1E66_12840 [Rhodospirillales bacterium]
MTGVRSGREETGTPQHPAVPAIVVFDDNTDLKWLRPLHAGFRHCFVAVRHGNHWIICNPFSHYTDLSVVHGSSVGELAEWYRRHGLRVVETVAAMPPPRCAPLRPFTCVEAVKRALGLRAPWIFTPRQLYRHLVRQGK